MIDRGDPVRPPDLGTTLVFVAGDSAANWAGSIRVVGTADVGGTPVTAIPGRLSGITIRQNVPNGVRPSMPSSVCCSNDCRRAAMQIGR